MRERKRGARNGEEEGHERRGEGGELRLGGWGCWDREVGKGGQFMKVETRHTPLPRPRPDTCWPPGTCGSSRRPRSSLTKFERTWSCPS